MTTPPDSRENPFWALFAVMGFGYITRKGRISMNYRKLFFTVFAAAFLVMGLCACTRNQPEVTVPETMDSGSSVTVSEATETEPVVTELETAGPSQSDSSLTDLLDSIRTGVTVGTAGSSLRAVPYGVQLLQWATDSTLTQDEIQTEAAAYLVPLGNDAQAEFVQQIELVYDMALELLSPRSADVCDSAGVSPVSFAGKTLEALNPVMVALGTEESQLKAPWQVDFERSLFENYEQIPSRYEALGDGIYQVYVWIEDQEVPYVTVNSETGDYHG